MEVKTIINGDSEDKIIVDDQVAHFVGGQIE